MITPGECHAVHGRKALTKKLTTTLLLHRHEQRGRECAANNDGVLVGAERFPDPHLSG